MSSSVISNTHTSKFGDDGCVVNPSIHCMLDDAMTEIEESGSVVVEKKRKTKKTKKTKDPDAPKRPTSAYFYWLGENRSKIKEALGDESKPTVVIKEAGRQWRALTDEEKAPFNASAKESQMRYKTEMETYEPKKVPVVDVMSVSYPEAPEGWSGPFYMMYLFKNAKGDDGKAKSFKSFEEAIDAAGRLEGCGGITKTSRGYSLRVGPDLLTTTTEKTSNGEASWLKDPELSEEEMGDEKLVRLANEILCAEKAKVLETINKEVQDFETEKAKWLISSGISAMVNEMTVIQSKIDEVYASEDGLKFKRRGWVDVFDEYDKQNYYCKKSNGKDCVVGGYTTMGCAKVYQNAAKRDEHSASCSHKGC
jgi:high mobility group protein B3